MAIADPVRVEPGTVLLIGKGPFAGLSAVVNEAWSGGELIKATLTLFGRPVQVDLTPWQINPPLLSREDSWPEGTSLGRMLGAAGEFATDRQRRLFSVACCRRIWHLMTEARCAKLVEERESAVGFPRAGGPWPSAFLMQTVELAERAADGEATDAEIQRASANAELLHDVERDYYDDDQGDEHAPFDRELSTTCTVAGAVLAAMRTYGCEAAARCAALAVFRDKGGKVEDASPDAVDPDETAAQRDLVRDIFGRPLRLESADPAWLTPPVLRLARGIYDDRDFGLMPILGDALEDAGCADDAVLSHLRADKPHARGCWVLDLLLGR
jgi:hypothetical protein